MASPAYANSCKPDPITGEEDLRDLTHPRHALSQFYRAFNTRDIVMMQDNWSDADDISMDNPIGGISRGWPEIRRTYERLFSSTARVSVEFHTYTIHSLGDVFYAVGREYGHYYGSGVSFELHIRTTRVFRFERERWRQVHHHGSIDDPALLQRYQSAVNFLSLDRPRSLHPIVFNSTQFPLT